MSAAGHAPGATAPVAPSTTLALQCVSSVCGTMIGQTLGHSVPEKLAGGLLLCVIGAFLMAPGSHRRRRVVAVALVLALLAALRRAGDAVASTGRPRRPERGAGLLTPASWGAVALATTVGLCVGSLGTAVTEGWASTPAALISVPAVAGQSAGHAQARLERADLSVVRERVASVSVARDTAIGTSPGRGVTVKTGSRVTLFVSTGAPGRRVPVPDVHGLSEGAARTLLEQSGLRVRRALERSGSVPSGSATRTSPGAHEEVRRGARVKLFVSSGSPARRITIPAVRGLGEGRARALLKGLGLEVGRSPQRSNDVARGRVTGSSPDANTRVDAGSHVTLIVSSGTGDAAQVVVPDIAALSESAALRELRGAGLDPTALSVASADVLEGDSIDTDPPAGESVDRGAPIVVRVSSGPAIDDDTPPDELDKPPPVARVQVPQLVGVLVDEAQSRLIASKLRPGSTIEEGSAEPKGKVLSSDRAAGSFVDAGTTVGLTVSSGTLVRVPDLIGKTAAVARRTLREAGLKPAVAEVGSEPPSPTVTRTDPLANTEVSPGSTVTVSCGSLICPG